MTPGCAVIHTCTYKLSLFYYLFIFALYTTKLSTTLNATVEELLRNSSMLSDGAGQLAEDVSTLMNAVMELRQSAEADQEAIAMVIASAIETILRSGSVEERIRTANVSSGRWWQLCVLLARRLGLVRKMLLT